MTNYIFVLIRVIKPIIGFAADRRQGLWALFQKSLCQTTITFMLQQAVRRVSLSKLFKVYIYQPLIHFSAHMVAVGSHRPDNIHAEYYTGESWTAISDYPLTGKGSIF